MRIHLLSLPGCPNMEPAREALCEAMNAEQLGDDIEEIDVARDDSPSWAKRWGSPTILIDDVDVAGESPSAAEPSCRLYEGGAPSVAQIRARISAARSLLKQAARPRQPVIAVEDAGCEAIVVR